MDEGEVVRPPSVLSSLDTKSHPIKQLDVEWCPIEGLELLKSFLQPVEACLCVLKQVPSVRIRNEALRLPAMVNLVELIPLRFEELW